MKYLLICLLVFTIISCAENLAKGPLFEIIKLEKIPPDHSLIYIYQYGGWGTESNLFIDGQISNKTLKNKGYIYFFHKSKAVKLKFEDKEIILELEPKKIYFLKLQLDLIVENKFYLVSSDTAMKEIIWTRYSE